MSTTTATPDATVSNTGTLVGGAGSAHATLADSSDSTYITLEIGQQTWCTFGNPSPAVPAGARIIRLELLVRGYGLSFVGSLPVLQATVGNDDGNAVRSATPPTSTRNWVAVQYDGDHNPASASFAIKNTGQGGSSAIALMKATLTVVYAAKPVIDVTAPTGTLTENNRPTVTWTNTLDSAGGNPFSTKVRIFSAAQYGAGGFDPATSTATVDTTIIGGAASGGSWRPDVSLPDATYRSYAQVEQAPSWVSFPSDWNYEGFVVNVLQPGVPTATVTAEPAATPVGRVKLVLGTTAGESGTTTNYFHVQRKDGTEWVNIRTVAGNGLVAAATTTIYDYEAPVGEVATYRVRAVHNYSSSDAYSDWCADKTVTLTTTSWSLVHPTDPTESLNVELRSFAGHGRAARQSVIQPVGRSDAVVISDTRAPESGEIVFRLRDDSARDAVMAIAALNVPVLLRPQAGDHEPSRWVALGDEQIERLVDQSWADERNGTYSWTEVAEPTGNLAAWS